MFGIVLLHCAGNGTARAPWLANLLKFCVVGFFFVSGYFGIRFAWRKLLLLYGVAAFCAAIGAFVQWGVMGDMHVVSNAFTYMKRFWFLHAYAVLMLVAPILNLVFSLKGRDLLPVLAPAMFLVFGWSYCFEIGHLKPYVFETAGLGAHTSLTLIGIYLAARWFQSSDIENCIPNWLLGLGVLLMLPVAAIGLAPYNSVFAFVMASFLFLIFKRHVSCGEWPGVLAPSMFSVYLLHVTAPGLALIRHFVVSDVCVGGGYLRMLVVAIVLFSMCLAVDLLRRLVLAGCRRFMSWKRVSV